MSNSNNSVARSGCVAFGEDNSFHATVCAIFRLQKYAGPVWNTGIVCGITFGNSYSLLVEEHKFELSKMALRSAIVTIF